MYGERSFFVAASESELLKAQFLSSEVLIQVLRDRFDHGAICIKAQLPNDHEGRKFFVRRLNWGDGHTVIGMLQEECFRIHTDMVTLEYDTPQPNEDI